MTDRRIAQGSLAVSIVALVIAGATFFLQGVQYETDYEEAVVISPGILPVKRIPSDKAIEVDIHVTNTAKADVGYFLRVSSNSVCVDGAQGRDQLFPCTYESRIIRLSKPEAGIHNHVHKLRLKAPSQVDMPVLAHLSDPKYFLDLEVVSSRNGRILFKSNCYYVFDSESKSLVLHEPVLDSSGQSKVLQGQCGL